MTKYIEKKLNIILEKNLILLEKSKKPEEFLTYARALELVTISRSILKKEMEKIP